MYSTCIHHVWFKLLDASPLLIGSPALNVHTVGTEPLQAECAYPAAQISKHRRMHQGFKVLAESKQEPQDMRHGSAIKDEVINAGRARFVDIERLEKRKYVVDATTPRY